VRRTLTTQVLVIGGGINGAGIARDLALRGVRVALVEKGELGGGTSWASSGMIHGGLRYLQKDPQVTLHSCVDSGNIQRIAPHLIFRIPFLMPVFRDDPIGPELVEIGLEMYDRFQPFKRGKPHTRLSRQQALRLEPALSPEIECAFSLDEWGVDAARLCAANALDAADRGAQVRTHTEAISLLREAGRVSGARVRDGLTGEEWEIEAQLVMNAAGPWLPKVARLAGLEVKLRPGKGVHLVFERRVSDLAIYARGIDGRDMFTFPHEQNSMAGTTDDDFYGDLDRMETTEDEVAYVLQAMERSIPSIRRHRICHVTAGVRPTLFGFGKYEDELSRDYQVIDHGERDGLPGLFTIAGGKLAAYRLMAEDATDRLCAQLGVHEPCRTAHTPLPGGEAGLDVAALARRFRVSWPAALRLFFRHGAHAPRVLAQSQPAPSVDPTTPAPRIVCACEPVTDAELVHVALREGLRTLTDCSLRVRLGVGACQGASCAAAAAGVLAEALGWSAEQAAHELINFSAERWRVATPALAGAQIAALELHRASDVGARGLARVDPADSETEGPPGRDASWETA
jgi:glycerol-3-phosphate dehydrogenase